MSNVLKVSLQTTIYSLADRGWSQRRIASELEINRETVRRYLRLRNPAISDRQAVRELVECRQGCVLMSERPDFSWRTIDGNLPKTKTAEISESRLCVLSKLGGWHSRLLLLGFSAAFCCVTPSKSADTTILNTEFDNETSNAESRLGGDAIYCTLWVIISDRPVKFQRISSFRPEVAPIRHRDILQMTFNVTGYRRSTSKAL